VLRVLAADPELAVDGLLLPGHVSVILGEAPYSFLSERHGIACAIAGFEAEEILLGLTELLRQIRTNRPTVRSLYGKQCA
jgi:hydrogenase expression/formation protein HypD